MCILLLFGLTAKPYVVANDCICCICGKCEMANVPAQPVAVHASATVKAAVCIFQKVLYESIEEQITGKYSMLAVTAASAVIEIVFDQLWRKAKRDIIHFIGEGLVWRVLNIVISEVKTQGAVLL